MQLARHIQKSKKHYAWIDPDELLAAKTLAQTFRAWGWALSFDGAGAACGIDGPSGDKVGDEKVLFDTIAPFVESGSYIQIIYDSDNSIWRWIFEKGCCVEVEAELGFR